MKKIILISIILIFSLFITSCWEEKIEKNNTKEQNQEKQAQKISEEISKTSKELFDKMANWEITDQEAEKMMLESINNSKTIQDQLELQKEQMPKLLKLIKEQKKCIENTNNKTDLLNCVDDSKKLAEEMWISDMYMDEESDKELKEMKWDDIEKQKALEEINQWISEMESIMPCIKDAKVITDMVKCYEK